MSSAQQQPLAESTDNAAVPQHNQEGSKQPQKRRKPKLKKDAKEGAKSAAQTAGSSGTTATSSTGALSTSAAAQGAKAQKKAKPEAKPAKDTAKQPVPKQPPNKSLSRGGQREGKPSGPMHTDILYHHGQAPLHDQTFTHVQLLTPHNPTLMLAPGFVPHPAYPVGFPAPRTDTPRKVSAFIEVIAPDNDDET
jgi:hypothetical protein